MNQSELRRSLRALGYSRIIVVKGKTKQERSRKIDELCRQDAIPMIDIKSNPHCSILLMINKHGMAKVEFETLLEWAGPKVFPGSTTLNTFGWKEDEPLFGTIDLDL